MIVVLSTYASATKVYVSDLLGADLTARHHYSSHDKLLAEVTARAASGEGQAWVNSCQLK